MKRLILLVASALLFVGGTAWGQPADCPWKLSTGHWRLTGVSGDASDVVWKVADGDSIIGLWDGKDGKATEFVGWRSDTKELVATGYGPKGEYWEVVFTTVTKTMVKGKMIHRTPEGVIKRGIWQVTRKNDDEMPTRFVGTRNGEEVSEEGCFKRVK